VKSVDKNLLSQRLEGVRQRIRSAETLHHRQPGATQLLAVSKTREAGEIRIAAELGQQAFGENYLQEALTKIEQLRELNLEWHFIGRIQSNKTKAIAENFDWIHSIASLKHARRLSEQRPAGLPPLKICLQVNTSGEASKDGHEPEELERLIADYAALPNLTVMGLMTIPAPAEGMEAQRRPFRLLRELRDRLRSPARPLETLSMGMSDDLEAAIAEGATLVRIGTAIFGPRQYNEPD
jgi:pyridoxal phosphate enzyme (YggS family)